jgi:hypothetical protein
MNFRRLFLYLLIGSVGLSALLGIIVLLFGNFGMIEVRVLMTTLTVTVMSIFGLACGAYFESGRGRALPITGIVVSVIAAMMAMLIVWDVLDDYEIFIKSFLTATIIAAACSHISLLSLARLDRRFAWTRGFAAVCVGLMCVIFLYILWMEPIGGSDLIYRVLGILGILIAAITVITPVLHKLSTPQDDTAKIDAEIARLRARIDELEAMKTAASKQ